MLTLPRLRELAGLNEDRQPATQMTSDQVLRLLTDAIDNMAQQAIQQLCEVDFLKLDKLRTLANHPNTSPEERAAALAAMNRIRPPKPPEPDVPEGGYVSKGKVFSPGPAQPDTDKPQPRPSYTTARGKTFA